MKTEIKKVLLFDVYQTLIDIDINEKNKKENKIKAWDNFAETLAQYGIRITATKLIELYKKEKANFYIGKDEKIYHHNFCDIISRVLKENLSIEFSQEKIYSLLYEYHKISRGYACLYPGIIETLIQLQKKYILAIASYTQECFTKFELKELDIDRFFSYFIYTSDVGFHKASPKFYEHCLKVVNQRGKDCVMIGDNFYVDIFVPQKLGIQTIWVKNPLTCSQYAHTFNKEPKNMIDIKEFIKLPEVIEQIFN